MAVRDLVWKLTADGGKFALEVNKADGLVDKLKKKTKDTDRSLGSMFSSIGSKFSSIGDKLKGISAGFGEAGARLGKVSAGLGKVGAGLSIATLPLSMKLKQGIDDVRELDTAIRKVTTLADESLLPRDEIEKSVKRISNEAGIAQAEISEAMYEALSSGIATDNVVDFTEKGIKLVRAGFTDLPTVIDATTTALNAYGDKALDVGKIQDIFVKTQDLGKITVDELGKNIGRVVPIAASANVNIDQLGAAYSILTARGQNAYIATTNLNGLLVELSSTGSKADKTLRQATGKSFRELAADGMNLGEALSILKTEAEKSNLALGDIFSNISAQNAANTLSSLGADGYTDILGQMQNSDGTVDANYEKMMGDELAYQQTVERIKNAWMDLSKTVMPYVAQFLEKIGELAAKFQELDPSTQKTIGAIAGIVVVAGPLIGIFSALTGGAGLLMQGLSFLVSPVGLVVAGLGMLFAVAVKSAGGFTELKNKALSALEAVKQKWEAVKSFLANPIKGVISIGQKIAGYVGEKTQNLRQNWAKSHASGLNYVPRDNYLANLHKGEMVLTKSGADSFRQAGGNKFGGVNGNSYSPTININVSGNADKSTVEDIRAAVQNEMDRVFRKMTLQRA